MEKQDISPIWPLLKKTLQYFDLIKGLNFSNNFSSRIIIHVLTTPKKLIPPLLTTGFMALQWCISQLLLAENMDKPTFPLVSAQKFTYPKYSSFQGAPVLGRMAMFYLVMFVGE